MNGFTTFHVGGPRLDVSAEYTERPMTEVRRLNTMSDSCVMASHVLGMMTNAVN